jgi:hypothetical protein
LRRRNKAVSECDAALRGVNCRHENVQHASIM